MNGASENLRKFGWLVALVAAMCAAGWIAGLWREMQSAGPGKALDVDFAVFWGAAKLTLAQGPLVPFDMDALNAARSLPEGTETFPMLWLYPPGWLSLLLPFGMLSFFWAWLAFGLISFALFAYALRRPAQAIPGGWPLAITAPAVLITLALGQNSLIFAALLVLVLEALRRQHHLLAGLLIAAMTLKPQLGLAIPVVLIAAGYWRVILWACLGTAAIVLSSLIWPGADYWPLFFQQLKDGGDLIRQSDLVAMMTSGYGSSVMAGLDRDTAFIAQAGVSLLAAAALAWLWWSKAAYDLKAAGLAFAILLITPYAIYYELVFAIVGVMYLARAGALVGRPGAIFAILIWLLPVLGLLMLQGPGFAFSAPLVALGLGIAVYSALQSSIDDRGAPEAHGTQPKGARHG
ncbi:MAG: glycosyltransferase family 87 protein [Pseudomonadota bacterium]